MQNSSAATRQPSFHLRQGAEETCAFFFFFLGRAGSLIFLPSEINIPLQIKAFFKKRWWKPFFSPHFSPFLCVPGVDGAFSANLRQMAQLHLATRTLTLMGFPCLSLLDKCSSVSQMPRETTVAGISRTCASNHHPGPPRAWASFKEGLYLITAAFSHSAPGLRYLDLRLRLGGGSCGGGGCCKWRTPLRGAVCRLCQRPRLSAGRARSIRTLTRPPTA